MNRILLIICLLTINISVSQTNLNREFRGVWIATVSNIDWPSSRALSSEEQQREFIQMLDLFKSMNFNAIIFQIRPSADAFYNSKYEPWSYYLTGTNDKAPAPYYDPLAFMIEETHKRGMEFHAWLNPYRAMVNYHEFRSNPLPLTYEKSEWFINYGKNKYFDPGIPEVRAYTNAVVKDILLNYEVDAIHFDDYFYPYKIEGEEFPDQRSFELYGDHYYPHKKDDWRRNNVNLIIKELATTIKDIKPWVQFGISPFGVWRNQSDDKRGSATRAGQTNYDDLYADIVHWMQMKWIDYILPQAYWEIGHERADYKTIVEWWAENNHGVNLYIGHGAYRLGNKERGDAWLAQKPTEIEKQLELNKSLAQIKGSVYFSARTFLKDPFKINKVLGSNYYKHPILPPVVNQNIRMTPERVRNLEAVRTKSKHWDIRWKPVPENKEKEASKFLVYLFDSQESIDLSSPSHLVEITGNEFTQLSKKDAKKGSVVVVVAVSRNNDMSTPSRVVLQ